MGISQNKCSHLPITPQSISVAFTSSIMYSKQNFILNLFAGGRGIILMSHLYSCSVTSGGTFYETWLYSEAVYYRTVSVCNSIILSLLKTRRVSMLANCLYLASEPSCILYQH